MTLSMKGGVAREEAYSRYARLLILVPVVEGGRCLRHTAASGERPELALTRPWH